MNTRPPDRFDALDGLRGVAAVAVMVYHVTVANGLHYLPGAWAAVDLFFLLSGFVVMHSYGTKVQNGMSLATFLKVRLIRLLPLYFVGLALGIFAAEEANWHHEADSTGLTGLAQFTVLGLFMVPYGPHTAWLGVGDVGNGSIFPLNPPAWSLFFELLVNVLFFACIARFKRVRVWWVLAAMAAMVLALVHVGQPHVGWATWNMLYGVPRVVAEFFLGTLVYAGYRRWRHQGALLPLVLVTATLGMFFVSASLSVSLLDTLVLEPLAILQSASLTLSDVGKRICKVLGDLSYPLYITHVPLFEAELRVFHIARLPPLTELAIVCSSAIALAWLLTKVDRVVREALTRRFLGPALARRSPDQRPSLQ